MPHPRLPIFSALAIGLAPLAAEAARPPSEYPTKPIRLVIPFTAGATSDILARIVFERAAESLRQFVVIDNRPGAGGTIGAVLVARAEPNGYTLAWGTTSNKAIAPALYREPGYDVLRDFAPVAKIAQVPHVITVHPKSPAATLAELAALAGQQPGRLSYASSGNGTVSHLIGELFQSVTGTKLLHVPYKSSAAGVPDHVAGRIDVMFDTIVVTAPQIQGGQLRPLAVTAARRSPLLPDVPTAAEAGLARFEVVGWFGVFAPAATPRPAIARVSETLLAVLREPRVIERLRAQGAEPAGMSSGDFTLLVKRELGRWGTLVRDSGARID